MSSTEAGNRLYRARSCMLALERQLLDEVAWRSRSGLFAGSSRSARRPARAARSSRFCLCEVRPRRTRAITVDLTISDTQTIVEQVARRELELGGRRSDASEQSRRVRAVLPRRGDPRLPAGSPVRGHRRSRSTSCGTSGLIAMQEGAGVRQVIDDELRGAGMRLTRPRRAAAFGCRSRSKIAVEAGTA